MLESEGRLRDGTSRFSWSTGRGLKLRKVRGKESDVVDIIYLTDDLLTSLTITFATHSQGTFSVTAIGFGCLARKRCLGGRC